MQYASDHRSSFGNRYIQIRCNHRCRCSLHSKVAHQFSYPLCLIPIRLHHPKHKKQTAYNQSWCRSLYGICVLIVHHTRKQNADDKFDMISGTTALLGAADGGFILQKEKRTSNNATREVSGRDQPDQKLHLVRNTETLLWELERVETELWKEPPEPLLEKVAAFITADNAEWCGSPTELVVVLGIDMKANALSMKLNINAGRLFNEYGICYENKRCHDGRKVRLHLAGA